MSQYFDFMLNSGGDMDVSSILQDEINNMDIPLNFDNSELMSSEFFDSVLSMEKQNMDINNDFLDEFRYDNTSSEDGLSPMHNSSDSTSGDSEQSISHTESNNITLFGNRDNKSEILKGDDFFTILQQSAVQKNINHILEDASTKMTVQLPKKLIISKGTANIKKTLHASPKKQQVIRVQSLSGNGRSLFLPYNVKNVKKFKIINTNDFKVENMKVLPTVTQCQQNVKKQYAASTSSESVDEIDGDVENMTRGQGKPGDKVKLTMEEKRLLMKEGIHIPANFPLTKFQEKELKRIRRKIRNKISAQDSRKRKKEYVDQLEEKARISNAENEILKKRVRLLNRENTKLYEQLKKLQDVLFSPSSKATPTTCLMIVLFSTLLVCLPNLRTAENKDLEIGDQQLVAARRALLFNQKPNSDEDNTSLEEFLVFNKDGENEVRNDEDKENGTQRNLFVKQLTEMSKKYENLIGTNCSDVLKDPNLREFCNKNEADLQEIVTTMRTMLNKDFVEDKKFIEPDISDDELDEEVPAFKRINGGGYLLDDDDPPTKKIRISSEHIDYDKNIPVKLESFVEVEVEPNTLLIKKE